MKKIDIENWNGMYDAEKYPELTNGEAFHISLHYSLYRYGIPTHKIDKLCKVYNDAVSSNDVKVKSAIMFICDWNGFVWEHFFSY